MYLKTYNHAKQKILLEMSEDEFRELCHLLETHQMSQEAMEQLQLIKYQWEEQQKSGN
jgi:hypothetical protein